MKRTTRIILVTVFISASLIAQEKDILKDFDTVINKLDSFFSTNPTFVDIQTYSDAPGGKIYFQYKHIKLDVEYDVQKSNSLISPFIGIVNVTT